MGRAPGNNTFHWDCTNDTARTTAFQTTEASVTTKGTNIYSLFSQLPSLLVVFGGCVPLRMAQPKKECYQQRCSQP